MRLLVIANGAERGGAQEFLLEMLELMKPYDLDIEVMISDRAERSFTFDLARLNLKTHTVPLRTVANYPDMVVDRESAVVKSSDVVWLADEVYLVAQRIKKIKKDVPVIAHVHCFAIICPDWCALHGLRETCSRRCSLKRVIRHKQLWNERLAELGIIGTSRAKALQLVDFVTGSIEFMRWPMKSANVIGSIDGFVAPSKFARDLILTHLPQLKTVPFEVVPNPANVHKFSWAGSRDRNDRPRILYASGPSVQKGPHVAVYATQKLLEEGKEVTLSMLMVKGYMWIERLVRQLGLEKHVELLPKLDRNEVYRRMANSDLVLMPSIGPETFGRIPVEANRLGTPAIVSDRGALPDTVIDSVTGVVTSPTPAAMAEAIGAALSRQWDRELIAHVTNLRFNGDRITRDLVQFLSRFV